MVCMKVLLRLPFESLNSSVKFGSIGFPFEIFDRTDRLHQPQTSKLRSEHFHPKQYKDYGDRSCNLQVYIFEFVGISNAIALG